MSGSEGRLAARGSAQAVLERLSAGDCWSGEALGRELGISRAAVWKAVATLRGLGVPVEAVAGKGYRLPGPVEVLDRQRLVAELRRAGVAPLPSVDVWLSTPSTNLCVLGSQAGTPRAAFAEVQTAGRGRQGRRWWSAFGEQVQFSLAWHYQALPAPVPGLSLAVGVELAETLSRLGARGLQLKWPNDLLCKEGRKLAGILIELEGQVLGPCRVVVGVGVNHGRGAGGAEADRPVASLAEAGLEGVARNRLAAFLLSAVIRGCQRFGVTGLDDYREGWARWDALRDRPLSVVQAGATLRGWGAGISEDGALVLTLASGGQRVLHAGEVHIGAALADS
ncbi:biotin--[acetyl-CoA-carboxylase] ligase [Alkalilimnicola ehrlichii]|uniref:biotin--[acetyl-CoA-carboxylase] ligase n=1 Tax=Alkalilimnicola ehrlichii TaxID=351052 RepID=UPI003B9EB7CE